MTKSKETAENPTETRQETLVALRFAPHPQPAKRKPRLQAPILYILTKDPERKWTVNEILREINEGRYDCRGTTQESVRSVLSRLRRGGIIMSRGGLHRVAGETGIERAEIVVKQSQNATQGGSCPPPQGPPPPMTLHKIRTFSPTPISHATFARLQPIMTPPNPTDPAKQWRLEAAAFGATIAEKSGKIAQIQIYKIREWKDQATALLGVDVVATCRPLTLHARLPYQEMNAYIARMQGAPTPPEVPVPVSCIKMPTGGNWISDASQNEKGDQEIDGTFQQIHTIANQVDDHCREAGEKIKEELTTRLMLESMCQRIEEVAQDQNRMAMVMTKQFDLLTGASAKAPTATTDAPTQAPSDAPREMFG